jgi:hypothetical protein
MNADQALKDFVKKNITLLTSAILDKQDLKRAVHACYHVQHNRRFNIPSNFEIMVALLTRLKTSMSEAELHTLIDTAPLFKLTGEAQLEKLHDQIRSKKIESILTEQQLKDLRQVGAYEAVELHKGKEITEATQQGLKELTQRIQEKREEYASLPSILDKADLPEPEFDPTVDEIKPWWERFYLKGNPFPRKDGLSDISTNLWESVLIKTNPFQNTLSNLQRNPNYLFNSGFLLVGDYGYGKTTFIDYLSNYLINRDILPIRISSAKAHSDASGFNDSFLHKFRMELVHELNQMSIPVPHDLQHLEIEDQIIALASQIVPSRRKGIVVFMDDYHKYRSHFPQIYEFLGTLQVLKDTLTRKNLCVGFIVSGTPVWQAELAKNTQLMGFLDNASIVMPCVSHELICEVFNRRIAAYCFESTPRRIRPEFVQKLVSDLAGEQGIRGCIVRIVDELNNNNLAIVDSPVEIPEDRMSQIRQALEKDEVLRKSINKLRLETKFSRFTKEQIARCFEFLVQISVQEGIPETDKQFLEHKFYFQILHNCGLIQKLKKGANPICFWTLNYRLREATDSIFREHKYAPSDYLLKLYAFKDYQEHRADASSEQTAPLRELRSFFARRDVKLEKTATDNINSGLHLLEGLLLKSPTETSVTQLTSALQSLEHLTAALCNLESSQATFQRCGLREARHCWQFHPSSPEPVIEAMHRLENYEEDRSSQKLAQAVRSLIHALEDIAQKIKAQAEQLIDAKPLMSRPALHTIEENQIFQQCSNLQNSGIRDEHYAGVKKVTDYLELRFRKFFYLNCQLTFGNSYFEKCPHDVQRYAAKNLLNHQSFGGIQNKFDGITRAQYRILLLENNAIHDAVVTPIEVPWTSADWQTFVSMFIRENIKVAHQQLDSFSATEKDNYRTYFSFAEALLARMNQMVANCINKNIFILQNNDSSSEPPDYLIRCSFKPVAFQLGEKPDARVVADWPKKFYSGSEQHLVETSKIKKVANILATKIPQAPHSIVFQDLLEIEYIEEHYGISCLEFILSLAFLVHYSKKYRVDQWFGSSVAIRST